MADFVSRTGMAKVQRMEQNNRYVPLIRRSDSEGGSLGEAASSPVPLLLRRGEEHAALVIAGAIVRFGVVAAFPVDSGRHFRGSAGLKGKRDRVTMTSRTAQRRDPRAAKRNRLLTLDPGVAKDAAGVNRKAADDAVEMFNKRSPSTVTRSDTMHSTGMVLAS